MSSHIGSSFYDFLDEAGIRDEVTNRALARLSGMDDCTPSRCMLDRGCHYPGRCDGLGHCRLADVE